MQVFHNGYITLHHADARHLPTPNESIDCVVTSPPYWGLRDYGLGGWVGGDADCDHAKTVARHDGGRQNINGFHGSSKADSDKGIIQYANHCPKCDAIRESEGIGLEPTPDLYVQNMVEVFREVWRVLKPTGTVWLNLGDSYVGTGHKGEYTDPKYSAGRNGQAIALNNKVNGLKSKDLVGIPWRVAFALQADGWYLRSDIIWSKLNPMPESVSDRPTKAHEYIFLLTKYPRYYYDIDAIREDHVSNMTTLTWNERKELGDTSNNRGADTFNVVANGLPKGQHPNGRNKRSVWAIATQPYPEAHFATYPEKLVEPCILAGCPLGGVVLDPFVGSGTTMAVAQRLGRKGVGTDLSTEYLALASKRLGSIALPMNLGI